MNKPNTIQITLMGGLGNQLFQYAMGQRLAADRGVDLVLDARKVLAKGAHTGLAIDAFNIRAHLVDNSKGDSFPAWQWKLSRALRHYVRPMLGYYHETEFGYDAEAEHQPTGICYSGFWQSHKYIEPTPSLLAELSLKQPFTRQQLDIIAQMSATNSVAIHVRRGDYLSNAKALAKHGMCSLGYYQNAIAKIQETISDPTYFVFSDDPQWVRDNLNIGSAEFVSDCGFAPEIDLVLISKCQHQIIANSSFSWWGAYLNANPNKMVVVPTPWFDADIADGDMSPPQWLKISK